MKRHLSVFHAVPVIIAVVLISFLSGSCASDKPEGFAIYLTRDNIPPSQMEALSHVEIASSPVIAEDDIIYYNSQTHELKLTPAAFQRISALEVPTSGKSFVVCVDKGPVYWGAFWVTYSSQSFDGITIWKPLGDEIPEIVTIGLGYPASSFYEGDDPRDNEDILDALSQSGKLTDGLSLDDIDRLPSSMKGYELYSWEEAGQWNFTLITGTNRNKYLEEIISAEDIISEVGWIKIHVAGVDAIKTVLAKLPQNEYIFWSAGLMASVGNNDIIMEYPPQSTVNEIEEYATALGLVFTVP
jgi:hypothetical protein